MATSGESCASLPSLAHSASTPSTSLLESPLPPVPDAVATRKQASRRSLSLLQNLVPKEFSSLIRSGSVASRRPSSILLDQDQTHLSGVHPPDYDHLLLRTRSTNTDMSSQQEYDSRPRKSESRLYNFLHRSRSRSRSKNGRSASADVPPPLPLPNGHVRHSSLDPPLPSTSNSFSKPTTRSQSRPLSSTTTATHSTITSLPTLTLTRRTKRHPPNPFSAATSPPPHSDDRTDVIFTPLHNTKDPPTRPTSPKPPVSARRKLQNLFGIGSSSRKSSFSSRPSTPGSAAGQTTFFPESITIPVPPLPAPYAHHAQRDPPLARAQSPAPSRHKNKASSKFWQPSLSRKLSNEFNAFPASPGAADYFRWRSTTTPPPSHDRGASTPPPLPLPQPQPPPPPQSQQSMSTIILAPQPRAAAAGTVPQIVQTPPTPSRPITSPPRLGRGSARDDHGDGGNPRGLLPVVGEESGRSRSTSTNTSKNTGVALGGMGRVRNGSGTTYSVMARTRSGSGSSIGDWKGKEREEAEKWLPKGLPSPRLFGRDSSVEKVKERGKMLSTSGVGPPKDREGNGNGAGISVVGLPTKVKKSRHGSFDFERPSSATVSGASGSGQNKSGESSVHPLKRAEDPDSWRPPVKVSSSLSRKPLERQHRTAPSPSISPYSLTPSSLPTETPLTPHHTGGSGASSGGMHSTSTAQPHTGTATGMASSLGRKSGRNSQSSVFGGLSRHHGAFSFEPAVPPSTVRNDSLSNRAGVGRREGRGRSLDLGLGLSWAPTKVREDAVMPAFGRSISSSAKNKKENMRGKTRKEGEFEKGARGVRTRYG